MLYFSTFTCVMLSGIHNRVTDVPCNKMELSFIIPVNSTTKSPKPLKRQLSAYAIWVKENKLFMGIGMSAFACLTDNAPVCISG